VTSKRSGIAPVKAAAHSNIRYFLTVYYHQDMKLLLLTLFLISCSTKITPKEVIEINTVPRTRVYLMVENSQPVLLGVSPIKLQNDDLFQKNNSSSILRLKFSAPGFADEWLLMDGKNTVGKVNFKMKPVEWWNDKSNVAPSRVAQQIGSSIQEAYRLIRQGKVSQAKKDIERLQKQFPHAPIFYDVLGSLSVLENKNTEAIQYYEQSLKLSPSNRETAEILEKLKKGERQ
jgi:hypothetical protein